MRVVCSRLSSNPRITGIKQLVPVSRAQPAAPCMGQYCLLWTRRDPWKSQATPGQDPLQEALCIPWLFYSPFCLNTMNSSHSDFRTAICPCCVTLCMSVSVPLQNKKQAGQTCTVPQAGRRQRQRLTEQSAEYKTPYQAVAQFHSSKQILLPSLSQFLVWGITVALLPLLSPLQVLWWERPSPAAASERLKALRVPVFL